MRDRIRATFLKDSKWKERQVGLDWVFCHVDDPISFELCAEALGARPVIIRKRLMYEFYRRWIVFATPLPFMAAALPEDYGSFVHYSCGDAGLAIAVATWYWPGISTDALFEQCQDRGIQITEADLDRVDETGIVACNTDNWYVTGRRQRMDKDAPSVNWVHGIYT